MGQSLKCQRCRRSKVDEAEHLRDLRAMLSGSDEGGKWDDVDWNDASEPQLPVDVALALQVALHRAIAEEKFQKLLRRSEKLHPNRGQRSHADFQAFTTQLQGLLLHVYRTVLPESPWCLEPGWEGVRAMNARMQLALLDPRVVRMKEEINMLLGLPRHATIRPPAEEPVIVETPDGSGNVPTHVAPLLVDADGDAAHEFWVEQGGALARVKAAGR